TASIQGIVVVKPESGTVKRIRTAAGNRIEDGAGVATVLGAELIRNESHFLDEIRIVQWYGRTSDTKVVVVLTIDHEVIRTYSSAIRREVGTTGKSGLAGVKLTNTRRRECNVVNAASCCQGKFWSAAFMDARTQFR